MSGLDKIADQIKKEAQGKADAILAQAKEKAAKIEQEAADRIALYKSEQKEIAKRDVQMIGERFASINRQSRKQAILKTRALVIEDTVNKAKESIIQLPDQEYFRFLLRIFSSNAQKGMGELLLAAKDKGRMPPSFADECANAAKEQGGDVKLTGETSAIEHGFIIKYGKIEQNCSIESLFETNKNQLWDIANTCLQDKA